VTPAKGSKIFAVLSGVVDSGVAVTHDEEKIVKERIKGEHIAQYGKTVGTDAEVYSSRFSTYLAQKIAPEKLPEHVSKVKTEIIGSFKQETKKDEEKAVKKRVKKE
jgi:hypothetical protein